MMRSDSAGGDRGVLRLLCAAGLVSVCSTAALAICLQQHVVSCSVWYIDPDDGCPDIVSPTSISYNTIVPEAETPGYGWTQATPMSCMADITKRLPNDEGGCDTGEPESTSIPGGSQGSGEACELSGGGGPD